LAALYLGFNNVLFTHYIQTLIELIENKIPAHISEIQFLGQQCMDEGSAHMHLLEAQVWQYGTFTYPGVRVPGSLE
jgi:hypothetical protein